MFGKILKVSRPWGSYSVLNSTSFYWIKTINVNKGSRLSLQSHRNRCEFWFVLKGDIIAHVGDRQKQAKFGRMFFVSKNVKHRITGITNACVLEFAFGKVSEEDIIRYEDDYGRN